MKNIYGLSISLQEEIAKELDLIDREPDIKILPWNLKNGNLVDEATWYYHWQMPDGHIYLSGGHKKNGFYALHYFDEHLDFAISPDGTIIYYQPLGNFETEVIRHLLLTQVIPYAMNLKGIESLHASSVLSPSGVIAFLGKSGYGKSTLAASLIKSGFSLISDNVVPIYNRYGEIWTSSGPPDIGLWPKTWLFLNPSAIIEDPTEKCRLVLSKKEHTSGNFILSHIYLLNPSEKINTVQIEFISPQESLIELLKAAFRLDLTNNNMLQHQFSIFHRAVELVTIKKITYPESIPNPRELSSAIQFDINSSSFKNSLNLDLSAANTK